MSAPKYQLELAKAAVGDFSNLLSFTLQTWGEGQLAEYRTKISAAFAAITENPELGRKRHGMMMYQAGRHRIYYRLQDTTIYVFRILHDRMDAGRHLPE